MGHSGALGHKYGPSSAAAHAARTITNTRGPSHHGSRRFALPSLSAATPSNRWRGFMGELWPYAAEPATVKFHGQRPQVRAWADA